MESDWTVSQSKKTKRVQKLLSKISAAKEEEKAMEEKVDPLPTHFLPTDILILIVAECGDLKSVNIKKFKSHYSTLF